MGAKVSPCCLGYMDYLTHDTPTVTGILKGYDQLLNLVLDEVTEELQRECCSSPQQLDGRR